MDLESEIFKKSTIDYSKLLSYGFKKENDIYLYQQKILDNKFMIVVKINNKGIVNSKVIDLAINDEYLALNIKSIFGPYVSKVRDELKGVLEDIKNNCSITNQFIFSQTNRLVKYVHEKYKDDPQFLWDDYKAGVLKNSHNKWYGIIMEIDKSKIMNGKGIIEIINVKVPSSSVNDLYQNSGIYPAYHMNKKHWITISLDDSLEDKLLFELVNQSYKLVL